MTDPGPVDPDPGAVRAADREVADGAAATLARLVGQIEDGRVTGTAAQRAYLAGAADALRALAGIPDPPFIR